MGDVLRNKGGKRPPIGATRRGVFVAGTDTGVGKTVLAAAIAAALRAAGDSVRAFKPVVTGLDDPPDPDWPADHVLLAGITGQAPEDVAPFRFGPAVSPHLAAGDDPLDPAAIRAAAPGTSPLVVEGVGGLLVPLREDYTVRDLARDLGLPLVLAARPGLGTLNHTLLTLEAARAAGLDVRAVVLTPWPEQPSEIEVSNRDTLTALAATAIHVLPRLARADPALLAEAGGRLPVADWLGR